MYYEGFLYQLYGSDLLVVMTDHGYILQVTGMHQLRPWWNLDVPRQVCLWVEENVLVEMRFKDSFPSYAVDDISRQGRWQRLDLIGPDVFTRITEHMVPGRGDLVMPADESRGPFYLRWVLDRPPLEVPVNIGIVVRNEMTYGIYQELEAEPGWEAPVEHPTLFAAMEDAVRAMELRLPELPESLKLAFYNDLQACDQYIQSFDKGVVDATTTDIDENDLEWPTYFEVNRESRPRNVLNSAT